MFHPVHQFRIIPCLNPQYLQAATGDYVSFKNVSEGWIVANITQASGVAITLAPYQAVNVAGTGAKAISNGIMYWYSNDMTTDETLTQQSTTPATSYATAITTGWKMVIMQCDPGMFDSAGSTAFDCLTVQVSGGSTDDTIAVNYLLKMRYQESDTPATITN